MKMINSLGDVTAVCSKAPSCCWLFVVAPIVCWVFVFDSYFVIYIFFLSFLTLCIQETPT